MYFTAHLGIVPRLDKFFIFSTQFELPIILPLNPSGWRGSCQWRLISLPLRLSHHTSSCQNKMGCFSLTHHLLAIAIGLGPDQHPALFYQSEELQLSSFSTLQHRHLEAAAPWSTLDVPKARLSHQHYPSELECLRYDRVLPSLLRHRWSGDELDADTTSRYSIWKI